MHYIQIATEQAMQAELDQEAASAMDHHEEHPEEWPVCNTCGQKAHPTGTTKDGRVEFHCGTGGHNIYIQA